jgi:nucleobase:cation symporter-1, NCS1 family
MDAAIERWPIERPGVETIPDSERTAPLTSILWIWLAVNVGGAFMAIGATLTGGGSLSLWQVPLVALAGAVGSFAFVALVSLAGLASGAPTMVASRATFGVRGNYLPTAISWLVLAGWAIAACVSATINLGDVISALGLELSGWALAPISLVLAVGAIGIAYVGHSLIVWLQKWLGWVLGAASLTVCVLALTTINWDAVVEAPSADLATLAAAIGVVAAGTGVAWLSAGANFTRYLSPDERPSRVFGATLLGAGVPLMVLISTGWMIAVGTADNAEGNWLSLLVLILTVLGLLTTADVAVYSSALSLQTLGVSWSRPRTVLVSAAPVAVVTTLVVGVGFDFPAFFVASAQLLFLPLVAWVGVFGVDLIFNRALFGGDLEDTTSDGDYWFHGGFNWPAIGAWVVAIVLGLLCTRIEVNDLVWFSGPLGETWLGQASLGWLVAGISAGGIYWVLHPLTGAAAAPGRAHLND